MAQDILNELSRRSINISKNEETYILWHNSILTVRSEKGIHFFDFSYNLECLDKQIDCFESFMPNPKNSPATGMFTSKLLRSISNVELTEMIVNPAFWPHNAQLMQEMTNIIAFEWSPGGFIENNACALAVLTNIGNVEVFVLEQMKCTSVLNISSYVSEHFEECLDPPKSFVQLRDAVYTVVSSAMCWAPKLNQNNSCYFCTAQKNGNILFWLLQNNSLDVKAKYQGCIKLEHNEMKSILWIPKSDDTFLLMCSNTLGQVLALDCIIGNGVKLLNTHVIWPHKDRMVARYLQYTVIDDSVVFIFNKHRHLVVIMFDEKCNILSQYVNNVNDYRITSITNSSNGFYLATVNCKLYKIIFTVYDKNILVKLSLIEKKDPYSTHELYSFSFSSNNVICALGLVDRKLFSRKEPLYLEIIFSSTETKLESLISILLNNPTKKLTNYWDAIELLRYYTMKLRSMPSIDYQLLYTEASTDVYKLKVYLILATLYNNLKSIFKLPSVELLPEISTENIKERIFVEHAKTLLCNFYKNYKNNGKLNNFETECFIRTKQYLKYYCGRHKKDLSDFVENIVLNIVTCDCDYICMNCDEKIEGFSCKHGHLNMFCSLTFTAIENDDYLVCKCCRYTARAELYPQKPLCVLCDLHLHRLNI